jgi:chitin synthase
MLRCIVSSYRTTRTKKKLNVHSVMDTSYPDDNKLLLIIADGNITGKGERSSTPEILARILGYTMSPNDKVYSCASIGELTENRAKLQYGKRGYAHALRL